MDDDQQQETVQDPAKDAPRSCRARSRNELTNVCRIIEWRPHVCSWPGDQVGINELTRGSQLEFSGGIIN
ncbi:GD16863 [Drosophila simulans]|uniref:GD16863 n=1 Tax=Drosophila simulans TaxID=7240 RepID=B4R678_DROSI|nr:GD16863 [Drosophila simulans]